MRPPLPEGPYLVVGLARSGVAAVRMLAAHGEVLGTDSGTPDVPGDIEAHVGVDGVELLAWSETKIILRFWIVAAVCGAIGFTLYQQSVV